jgi:hypothetical protein
VAAKGEVDFPKQDGSEDQVKSVGVRGGARMRMCVWYVARTRERGRGRRREQEVSLGVEEAEKRDERTREDRHIDACAGKGLYPHRCVVCSVAGW